MVKTILNFFLSKKNKERWKKFRGLGKGLGTYSVSASTLLAGLGGILIELSKHETLAEALASLPELTQSNYALLVAGGLAGLFGRRSVEGVEKDLKSLKKKVGKK